MSIRTQRIVTMIATMIAFLLGIAVIGWDALRTTPLTAAPSPPVPQPLDLERIEAVLRDPVYATLVPLAPPIRPSAMGNRNPFHRASEVQPTP